MAPLLGPHDDSFEGFFASWTKAQEELMNELEAAVKGDMEEAGLAEVVNKVVERYEDYYKAKESACQQNILLTATPTWKTPLEKAFMWLGGWRPSLAFQVVYALAGQHIEAELAEFLEGVDTPTFASLSYTQLSRVSELQMATYKEEDELGQRMAELQQSFADDPLLSVAQAEQLASGISSSSSTFTAEGISNMDNEVAKKLVSLQELSVQADSLRLATFRKVLDILGTFQKGQYLVAAAKLQVALRKVGNKLNEVGDILLAG